MTGGGPNKKKEERDLESTKAWVVKAYIGITFAKLSVGVIK
jgi:hypothetical protein